MVPHWSVPHQLPACFYVQKRTKTEVTHGGTRTPNLRFRRPTPYPLGHAGTCIGHQMHCTLHNTNSQWRRRSEQKKEKKNCASPGNRTRVARMGILHDTTTPATPSSILKQQLTTAQSLYVNTRKYPKSIMARVYCTVERVYVASHCRLGICLVISISQDGREV